MYIYKNGAKSFLRYKEDFKNKVFDLWRDDKDVVLEAIKYQDRSDDKILKFVSERLRSDKEVVIAAVKINSMALKYANLILRNDKEVILNMCDFDGEIFKYVSKNLRDEKEIILSAIKQNGRNLRFCSKKIKNDKVVVLEAYKENEYSFKYASPEIQALCQGQDPIEALTKAIESEKLHAQLQQELSHPTPSTSIPRKLKKI